MSPTIPPNLPTLVRARFFAAKAANELTFYPTSVTLLRANSIPFQLRYAPALASKPKPSPGRSSSSGSSSKPESTSGPSLLPHAAAKATISPFLDPPPALLICALPPSHILVLNKFAVVPAHFILATREFKSQTALLDEADLEAVWGCLKAWKTVAAGGEGELFAFFNSGPFSGASQAHRHLQLLPVEMMEEGLQNEEGQRRGWDVLADRLVEEPERASELPFICFAKPLPREPTPGQLRHLYIELYERARSLVREYAMRHPDEDQLLSDDRDGDSAISYNLGLTDKAMVLCPRRAEGSFISDRDTGTTNIGPVSLNGTVLAGTLLVKNEAEWNTLRNDKAQLTKVLGAIGIPSSSTLNEKL